MLAARPDVGAVVHTHSPELTALACLRRPLPAIHYVIARAGGSEVPCAPYATYGSAELAANVVATLGAGWACLMANHGALTVGATLDAAVALAADLEWLAGVHRRAVSMGTRSCSPTMRSPGGGPVRDLRPTVTGQPQMLRRGAGVTMVAPSSVRWA